MTVNAAIRPPQHRFGHTVPCLFFLFCGRAHINTPYPPFNTDIEHTNTACSLPTFCRRTPMQTLLFRLVSRQAREAYTKKIKAIKGKGVSAGSTGSQRTRSPPSPEP